MLRRLYAWILALSDRPSAPYALGAVAFAESSFFPVPPDAMMVPMSVSRPDRVWFFATVATVCSVLGGLVGYAIGALLFDSLGQDRKSTRLNSSHSGESRMPSSA